MLTSNFALAEGKSAERRLTTKEFVVLVCFGQELLRRDRVIDLLNLDRGYIGSDIACPYIKTCDEALHQTYVTENSKRDGDGDGVPCEKICLPPEPFDQENHEGSVAWNCQIMRDALYPDIILDPYQREEDLEEINQSPKNPNLGPLE